MSIFKNLSLKIKAIENLQYFEISQIVTSEHMSSNILKLLHPLRKAFETREKFLYILLQTQEKEIKMLALTLEV